MTCVYCHVVLIDRADSRVVECRASRPGGLPGQAVACRDASACNDRQAAQHRGRTITVGHVVGVIGGVVLAAVAVALTLLGLALRR
jgi:hypothetical protein